MEPVWEYEWEYVESGHWGGVKRTGFYMTDFEAERWWGYRGGRRLDETKRDRNAREIDTSGTFSGAGRPWDRGGVPY
ncbi:hypothetical protein [Paraburkholderia tropica]|uniref:hypothetical protein n=1 Tax=Paraburkholderia tropica TaxID=92647 RepID=UPI002AB14AB0|nr:hypothetical protein [Paraburkholderia tropica]